MIPLASAIARSYPIYSQRTTLKKVKQLRVEFLVVEDYQPVSLKEMKERMEGGLDMLPKRSLSHLGLGNRFSVKMICVRPQRELCY